MSISLKKLWSDYGAGAIIVLLIVAYGVKTVVYSEDYEKDTSAKDIFKFYKVKLIKI